MRGALKLTPLGSMSMHCCCFIFAGLQGHNQRHRFLRIQATAGNHILILPDMRNARAGAMSHGAASARVIVCAVTVFACTAWVLETTEPNLIQKRAISVLRNRQPSLHRQHGHLAVPAPRKIEGQCTREQSDAQVRHFNAALNQSIYPFACPKSSMWSAFHEADPSRDKVVVNVGGNKGYSLVHLLEMFHPELELTSRKHYERIKRMYPEAPTLCGNCGDCRDAFVASTRLEDRNIQTTGHLTMHVVEPLPSNVKILEMLQRESGHSKHIHVHHGAISGSADTLFADMDKCGTPGTEDCNLTATASGSNVLAVPVWTLQSFLANTGLQRVDMLLVDTEGHDGAAIMYSEPIFKSQRVRLLEFEYHKVGLWGPGSDKYQLHPVVDMLDEYDYSCFFADKAGSLVELSGTCWNDRYEFFQWSNVVCVLRDDIWHSVAQKLCVSKQAGLDKRQ